MEHLLIVFINLQVASHKQLLMRHVVGSPEYKQITDVLKAVERLRLLGLLHDYGVPLQSYGCCMQ